MVAVAGVERGDGEAAEARASEAVGVPVCWCTKGADRRPGRVARGGDGDTQGHETAGIY